MQFKFTLSLIFLSQLYNVAMAYTPSSNNDSPDRIIENLHANVLSTNDSCLLAKNESAVRCANGNHRGWIEDDTMSCGSKKGWHRECLDNQSVGPGGAFLIYNNEICLDDRKDPNRRSTWDKNGCLPFFKSGLNCDDGSEEKIRYCLSIWDVSAGRAMQTSTCQ